MDLYAIGLTTRMIDGTQYSTARHSGIKKNKVDAEKEHSRPQDKHTSLVNKDKGRIIDVSF